MSADTPLVGEEDTFAVHVDEGYKSFSARNLVLFGSAHWSQDDGYIGWMRGSPLTQWFHVLVFSVRFPDRIAVRVLAVLASFLVFLALAKILFFRYRPWIAAPCLAVIGVSAPFFFYTRLSMFEPLLAAFVFFALATAARGPAERVARSLGVVCGLLLVATYGVKKSALLYFFPLLVAILLSFGWRQWQSRRKTVLGLVVVVTAVVAAFLFAVRRVWIERVELRPGEYLNEALFGPLSIVAPFLVAAAALAVLHLVIVEQQELLTDRYRVSLVALVVLGPAAIAVFPYNPPRYYVPILPVLVLGIAEWCAWQGWKRALPSRVGFAGSAFALTALVIAVLAALQGINVALLERLPLPLGEKPGLGSRFLFVYGVGPAAVVAGALWAGRRRFLRPRWIAAAIMVFSLGHVVRSLVSDLHFWIAPTYEGVELAKKLEETLAPDARVAGDWAPMAVIGTGLRALYVAPAANPPSKVLEIKPDYFLSSGNVRDRYSLAEIEKLGVEVSEPVLEAPYAGHQIEVLPLSYPPR